MAELARPAKFSIAITAEANHAVETLADSMGTTKSDVINNVLTGSAPSFILLADAVNNIKKNAVVSPADMHNILRMAVNQTAELSAGLDGLSGGSGVVSND
ncbi:MAG: hypothetical protein ACYCY2_14555 [Acidithiobacillus ferriphilus]|jgi:hypothetical protein